jgi:hypothetical protein
MIGDYMDINGAEHAVFPRRVPLTVQVREFDISAIDSSRISPWRDSRSAKFFYAIEPSSLPTAMQLDERGRKRLFEYSQIPHFRPYIMDYFLCSYLSVKPDLKYVSFLSPLH